jgi:hypothetical protein
VRSAKKTAWYFSSSTTPSRDLSDLAAEADGVAKIVLESVQNLLLKLALQMARDDYETRRERQRQFGLFTRLNPKCPSASSQMNNTKKSLFNLMGIQVNVGIKQGLSKAVGSFGRDFHIPVEYLRPGAIVKCPHCPQGIMLGREDMEEIKTKNALR